MTSISVYIGGHRVDLDNVDELINFAAALKQLQLDAMNPTITAKLARLQQLEERIARGEDVRG